MTREELEAKWREAKNNEGAWRDERYRIEAALAELAAAEGALPEAGTSDFGNMKITVTRRETWDQAKLDALAEQIPPEDFPFERVWKLDGRRRNDLATRKPGVYSKIASAATVKTGKPGFKYIEPED